VWAQPAAKAMSDAPTSQRESLMFASSSTRILTPQQTAGERLVSDPPAMLPRKEEDMKTTIRIAPFDAALVLRADGKLESWLPHIHGDPPPNALAASALMCAYFDKRIMSFITDAMSGAGYEYPDPPLESLTAPGDPSGVQ
jgi:hypothetical protein